MAALNPWWELARMAARLEDRLQEKQGLSDLHTNAYQRVRDLVDRLESNAARWDRDHWVDRCSSSLPQPTERECDRMIKRAQWGNLGRKRYKG